MRRSELGQIISTTWTPTRIFEGRRLCDQTDDVWFHYLLEWSTLKDLETIEDWALRQNAPCLQIDSAECVVKMDVFQEGPFHPKSNGHRAFRRALIDAIKRVEASMLRNELTWMENGPLPR